MRDGTTTGSGGTHVDAQSVLDAFTSLLQVGFLYPANNPRVADVSGFVVAQVIAFAEAGGNPELRVTREGLEFGDTAFPKSEQGVAWVRDRLVRARLLAIRFDPTIDHQGLCDFTVALRRCFPPNAPPFAQVWSTTGHGVTPMTPEALAAERGAGAAATPAERATSGPAQPGRAVAPTTPARTRLGGNRDRILAHLARSPTARANLGTIYARVEQEYDGSAAVDVAGMLEKLVTSLPEALCADPAQACAQIEAVAASLNEQLEGFLLARPDDPGGRLTEVAVRLLERRLSTAGGPAPSSAAPARPAVGPQAPRSAAAPQPATPRPASAARRPAAPPPSAPPSAPRPAPFEAPAEPPPPRPTPQSAAPAPDVPLDSFEGFLSGLRGGLSGGLAGASPHAPEPASDAWSEADVRALLEEVCAVPAAAPFEAALEDPMLEDELMGACLHLLAQGRETAIVVPGATRLIDPLMAVPTPRRRRMLGSYLKLAREGDLVASHPEAQERLVDFLQRNGVQHLMTARETLDVEAVARTFPTQLVMFLDGLELKDSQSEAAFQQLMDAVGDDAMIEATGLLIEDGTLLTPNRTEKLLKFGGNRAAPIARQFVRTGANWTRSQVVNYLRRQGLPRQESAALAIVQPVTSLPPAYLADLCEAVSLGQTSPKLHGYTSLLLRQYVRDTAERPGDLERRLYAIRALGHWASPETIQYLEQLSKEGRLLQQSKEARAVRQAAADALELVHSSQREAAS